MFNIFNMFNINDYKAIFESNNRVLLGHRKALDDDDEVITAPRYEVKRVTHDTWILNPDRCYSEDDHVRFPTRWRSLEGEELCRVINEDYELYKASGKDKRLLEQSKPSIDDAVESGYNHAIFESKESAILAGKIAIFIGDIEDDSEREVKNKPDWLY